MSCADSIVMLHRRLMGRPNVANSSQCEPTPKPKSNRPQEMLSMTAMSSATRSGLWNGRHSTDVPTRSTEVRAAIAAAMVSGDGVHWHGVIRCSPIQANSNPSCSR